MRPIVVILVLAFSSSLVAQDSTRHGATFDITCHFSNDAVCQAVQETAEQTWAHALKAHGALATKSKGTFPLHLYADVAAFETAVKGLEGFAPGHHSHVDLKTNAIHVAQHPSPSAEVTAFGGLLMKTRRDIAYAVMQLYLRQRHPSSNIFPPSLLDGAAAWGSAQAMLKFKWIPSLEADPGMSSLLSIVHYLAKDGAVATLTEILSGKIPEAQKDKSHALDFCFYHFFMNSKYKSAFEGALEKSSKVKGDGPDTVFRIFSSAIKLESANSEWVNWLKGLKPKWYEATGTMQVVGDDWLQVGAPETFPAAFAQEQPKGDTYTLQGSVRLLPGTDAQANVFLGDIPRGAIVVTITPGVAIAVFVTTYRDNSMQKLGEFPAEDLERDAAIPFVLAVKKNTLDMTIGGKTYGPVELASHDMVGRYGVGVFQSSAAVWSGVKLGK